MSKLKKMFRNKVFYVMLLFLVVFFPTAIMKDAEIDTKAVASAVGIDKTDDGVELSALVIVPNKSGSSESVKLATAKGETVVEAINNMSLSLGKVLGLAHCEALVFGEEAMYENLVDQMDFFVRTSNVATNALVINCSTKAKDLLTAVASDNNELALSLKNIINFNDEYLFTSETDIETFYKNYFSKSNSAFIPILSVEESDNPGGSGDKQGQDSQDEGGGSTSDYQKPGDSGKGSGKSSKKIMSEGRTSVIKDGVKVRELSEREIEGYNGLSDKITQSNISIEHVTDENFEDATLNFSAEKKDVSIKMKFDGDQPYCDINIKLVLKLDSVDSEGYNFRMQDSTKQYLTLEAEEKIREKILTNIGIIFTEMRNYETDTLFIARDFHRFHNKKWKKYLDGLEDKDKYLDGIDVRVSISMYGRL